MATMAKHKKLEKLATNLQQGGELVKK